MSRISRREFVKWGAGAAAVMGGRWAGVARAGANDRITMGVIGPGLMGSGHVRRLVNDGGIQVLAVCDVDSVRREGAKNVVESAYAAGRASGAYKGCAAYNDYREVLARGDIDAVLIATPDHWHTLISIDAAKAGKDVYCEKPISVTIGEGRLLAETMRRYGRVFQTGTQYRSIPTIRRVVQFVREGGMGPVKQAFALLDPIYGALKDPRFSACWGAIDVEQHKRTYTPLEFAMPAEPVPAGLDWNLYVGPAPWREYNRVYHINPSPGVVPWCFSDAFGVAAITWHLSHSTDVIQYGLGMERSGPVEILHPSGGTFPTVTCRYSNGTLLHFVDHWGMVREVYHAVPATARLGGNFGGVFVSERGYITSMSGGGPIDGTPEILSDLAASTREVIIGANNHHANFFECIRTRNQPSCDEEIGHRGASVGHLAFIAYKLGRSLKWDPVKEEFVGDEMANRLRSRAMREPWRV